MKAWFESWFDSPFYHILYKSRNEEEAAKLIDNLAERLNFTTDLLYCDLACGKGRHSVYLNKKGYNVVGLDLSPNSIKEAKKNENNTLKFFEHDIRNVFKKDHFDVILNLFTSFGYFESNQQNAEALAASSASLKKDGLFIIDYMNSRQAVEFFQTTYTKTVEKIDFHIEKKIEQGYIYKSIKFKADNTDFDFTERVKLLFLEDFLSFFDSSHLELIEHFGDYDLQPYEPKLSPRLLMVCRKR